MILLFFTLFSASANTEYFNKCKKVLSTIDDNIRTKNPCALVMAIIERESSFRPHAFNQEKSGSFGLMQIQCDTAKNLGTKNCQNLFNPYYNIKIGLKLLADLETRHDEIDDLIAAYNAGRVIKKKNEYINQNYVNFVKSSYYKHLKSRQPTKITHF